MNDPIVSAVADSFLAAAKSGQPMGAAASAAYNALDAAGKAAVASALIARKSDLKAALAAALRHAEKARTK